MRQNKLLWLLSLGWFSTALWAQTAATSLPYSTGFEDATDNAAWQMSQGNTINCWQIDTAACQAGSHALYISNDQGVKHAYSTGDNTTAFAYRTFQFEAWNYLISFDWKAAGESTYDLMQVLLLPSDVSLDGANNNNIRLGSINSFEVKTTAQTIAQAGYIRLTNSHPQNSNYPWMFNRHSAWQSESVEVTIPTKGDYNLVFVWQNDGSGGDNPPAAIDNLSISKNGCTSVQGVSVSQIGSRSAVLSWNEIEGVSGYDYAVVAEGTSFDADQAQRTADHTISLTALTPNTTYTAYTRAVCDEDAGAWTQVAFRTDCEAQSLPYTEDFEGSLPDGEKVLPYCWHRLGYNNYPYIFTDDNTNLSYHGERCLYFYGGNRGTESYAVLPSLTDDLRSLMLSFYGKVSNASAEYGKPIVGVMSDYTDPATFVPLDTLPATTTYTRLKTYFNRAPANHPYIAIQYSGGTSEYGSYLYIDDVQIDYLPTCIPARDIRIASVTQTAASLAWTAGADETQWQVRYTSVGSLDTITTRVSGTPSLTITPLHHSTLYSYWVEIVSDCGNGDLSVPAVATLSFATECAVFTPQRDSICFDFEEYSGGLTFDQLPCWDTFRGVGNASKQWQIQTGTAHSGNIAAIIGNQNDTTKSVVLVTPQIAIPEGAELSLYARSGFATQQSRNDKTVVYVNTTPDLNGATRLGEVRELTNTYRFYRFSLPVRGNQYILLEAYNYASVLIDDILISPEPACLPPTRLRLYSANAHEATLAWKPGKNETRWLVSADNHKDIFIEDELVENTPQFTVSDLPSSTTDTLYLSVRALCDDESESEVCEGIVSFTTACEPVNYTNAQAGDTLLVCGFEEDDAYEQFTAGWDSLAHNCWVNRQIGYLGYYAPREPITWQVQANSSYAPIAHSGKQVLTLPSSSSYLPVTILAIPGMLLSEGSDIELRFWSKKQNAESGNDSIEVYLNNAPEIAGATRLGSTSVISAEYTEQVFSPIHALDGLNYLILKVAHSKGYADLFIDDICVRVLPECRAIRSAEITDIAAHSLRVEWQPAYHEEAWHIVAAYAQDTLLDTTTTVCSAMVNGLQSGTRYPLDITITAVCDGIKAAEQYHATHTLITECEAISSYPWQEDFEEMEAGDETSAAPICWNILGANQGGSTSVFVTTSAAAYEGTRGLTLLTRNAYEATAFAILPELADAEGNELVFYYKSNYSKKPLEVGYLTDLADSTTWHTLATCEGSTAWTRVILPLTSDPAVAQPYFGFRYAPNYNYRSQVYIDKISVRRPAVCAAPSNLYVVDSLATPSSVTLVWTGKADNGYTVSLYGTDTIVMQTTDTFCVLDHLSAATRYTYRVEVLAHCQAGDAIDLLSQSLTLTTACAPITDFPWQENFDSLRTGTFDQICWSNEHIAGSGSSLFSISNYAWGMGSNTTNLLSLPDMAAGTYTQLVLPEIDIPAAECYDLTFDIYRQNGSRYPGEGVYILAETDTLAFVPNDYATIGQNIPAETEAAWYTYRLTLPRQGTQRIALLARSEYGNRIYIDNLSVEHNGKVPSAISKSYSTDNQAIKIIHNGQVYIVRDGKTYNLLGQSVEIK